MKLLFAACTRLFPREFREAFGDDVVGQAMHDYERARRQGRIRAIGAGVASCANVMASAFAERFRPTWRVHSPHTTRGFDMRHFFDQWRLDGMYAIRALRRTPGFTGIAVLTLALAIGVTTGMFAVVNAVLIKPLPFADPNRLVFIVGTAPGSDFPPEFGVSSEFFLHYRDRAPTLEDVALISSFTSTMRVGDRAERIRMSGPTWNMFSTLGVAPVLGRLPGEIEADEVAVISHATWQSWFGGRDDVIGQAHWIGDRQRTIVGVMGPEFRFPVEGTQAWITSTVREAGLVPGRFGAGMIGRMKPGVTHAQAARELTDLSRELPTRFGGSAGYGRLMNQYIAVVRSLNEQLVGSATEQLWVMFGAAALVLLIACANVANLFLVRGEGRMREMAVRQAIGAQRAQLLRVQMAEVFVVAGAAGVLATLFARFTLPVVLSLAPPGTIGVLRLGDAGVDFQTIAFTVLTALLAAIMCGLWPAIRASRPSFARLRDGSRGSTSGRMWTRHALVAAQTALALVLLIGAGLLFRSHLKLSAVDPGYDTEDIFTFQIAPEQRSLTDGPSFANFIMDFTDRLRALPGVEAVGVIENVPIDEGTAGGRFRTDGAAEGQGALINYTFAGEDYYRVMGISVLAGRAFTRDDAVSSLGNVVISKRAADMLWPGVDPIGRKLQRDGFDTWETVVGVVEDVMQQDFRQAPDPLVYFPLRGQLPTQWRLSSPAYAIKSSRADTIAADVRRIVRDIAPEAPMYRAYTMQQLAERSMFTLSFTTIMLAFVSSMALILGAIGLYGVLSYIVSERTREIGVRLALGAQVGTVRRMVVAQGARVLAVGVVIGLAVAVLSTRALGTMLYGVDPHDVMTFAGTAVLMAVIGLGATYLPARRASNVDPIVSLRGE